ncbi:protein SHORT HYPOCOTYL IN WHITE LIGHT 1-like isoform X3 [Magnolia sinica]|uniref:protein SHORT HYPOCOTYL IN WHITE LIGHT 1-like isoform X3 n=1 Tax=Magnolia sinica TaxID=86752 RepID=UPI0026586B1D|nr:protein SHORT HYPOCOTYL IN WHITE LIGHT 1-like isoform X3 [Magnolia sinica]
MAAKAVALSPLPRISSRIPTKSTSPIIILTVHSNASHFPSPLRSSRRISNYTQEGNLIAGPRDWGASGFDVDDDDDDSDEDDDDDRSLDLLVRFFQNMFRKISRRARKAVRSVLPVLISPSLVVCTLGTVVYVSILLIRVIWSGISYVQHNRNTMANKINDENSAWTGAQPAT